MNFLSVVNSQIITATAFIVGKCPTYWAVWWTVFPTLVVAVLVLLIVVLWSTFNHVGHPAVYWIPEQSRSRFGRFGESALSSDPVGQITIETHLDSMFKSGDNVFFVTDRGLNWRSSCSLESILKVFEGLHQIRTVGTYL